MMVKILNIINDIGIPNKPNFLGLGAAKCGTTSIAYHLSQHEEVFIPDQKELHYFDSELDRISTLRNLRYFMKFDKNKAIGEYTPSYLFDKRARDNIYNTLGSNVKFLVSLRNPVKRAYSHYCHAINNWWKDKYRDLGYPEENLSFKKALEKEPERLRKNEFHCRHLSYFSKGLYYEQLTYYLEKFDKENFHINTLEELKNDELKTMNSIFEFLGVSKKSNISLDPDKKNSQTNKPIESEIYNSLLEKYMNDINCLEKLIGKNLSKWKEVKQC